MLLSNVPYTRYETGGLAARSDGSVVCVTCSGIVSFDAGLHETGRMSNASPVRVAVGPDDATYAITPGATPGTTQLVALSPAGELRWKAPFAPTPYTAVALAASADGAYIGMTRQVGASTYELATVRFDPATGEPHELVTGQYLLGATHGPLTVEHQGKRSVTLHQLDPAGNPRWSHALSTTIDGIELRGAVATSDGGAIVFGYTPWAVDFGDRTVAITHGGSFVVGFDAAGATQWGFQPDAYITDVALTAQGDLLLAGQAGARPSGSPYNQDVDGIVLVATPAGVSRTLELAGPGGQMISGLAAAPDGAAWVQVESFKTDDNRPAAVLQIGDRTFADEGMYLLELVP